MSLNTDALNAQMQTFERARTISSSFSLESLSNARSLPLITLRVLTGCLPISETYSVYSHICDLVEQTLTDVPDIPFSAEHFLSGKGWVYLEKPYMGIKAISWAHIGGTDTHGQNLGSNYGLCEQCNCRHRDSTMLSFFVPDDNGWLMPNYCCGVIIGDYIEDNGITYAKGSVEWVTRKPENDTLIKYVRSLLYFMRSRIVVISTGIPDRAARRRAGRENFVEKPINEVKLRVVEYDYPNGNGNVDVEWSCRWIVRGHWRRQYYPSKKMYDLIWIMPFMKGPEDKPLKKPGAKVFSVVR